MAWCSVKAQGQLYLYLYSCVLFSRHGHLTLNVERIVLLDFIHRLVSQKIEELKIYIPNVTIHLCVCVYLYWYFGPPCVFLSVSSCVTNCHLGFSLASSVPRCMWVCVCLGLYAILVFPRF
jgi:hypothetical protein